MIIFFFGKFKLKIDPTSKPHGDRIFSVLFFVSKQENPLFKLFIFLLLFTPPNSNPFLLRRSAGPVKKAASNSVKMALEWVVIGYAAGAEAIMLILLTLPQSINPLRKGLISATKALLKPFLSVVPFALFLIMDINWKYRTRLTCSSDNCSPSDYLRHEKSILKSQRNAILIAAALMFYWLLYSVTKLLDRIDELDQRIQKLKNED